MTNRILPDLRNRLSSLVVALKKPANAFALAAMIFLAVVFALTVEPIFANIEAWGGQDWDMVSSFRYLTVKSIREYGQFPFWNPYACGGFTSWGYVESGTNVVSPWMPLYFLLPLQSAVRWEAVGTAAIAVAGAWCLAGRFTRSVGAKVFAAGVFALNSRWAMQVATGHLMHSYYAWTPWVFFWLDRAMSPPMSERIVGRDTVLCAVSIALLVYTGAIYPLPHTLLAMGLYGVLLTIHSRQLRPTLVVASAGALGLLLAVPKLLPTIDAFMARPRETTSGETMGLGLLIDLFTTRGAGGLPVPQWGFAEWGIYIGWPALVVMAIGWLAAFGPRERALKFIAGLFVLVGLGSFHKYAPWTLLHHLPVFRSQHVPSRWLYPAVLFLTVLTAAVAEKLMALRPRFRPVLEAVLLIGACFIVFDVADNARAFLRNAFWMQLQPSLRAETVAFHQEKSVPPLLHYVRRDWAPPSLPGMIANVGLLECWSVVPMSIFARDASGHVPGQGALGMGDPSYKGEAYTASGQGKAAITSWSPNRVVVHVDDAVPGDTLILNENFDTGWNANGSPAYEYREAIGTRLTGGSETIVFRYRPRTFVMAMVLMIATVAGLIAMFRRRRRHTAPAM